ncbi:MAG: DUF4070 domain-containing protein [Myxococcota bacterium]|nr:DUF4070 domain-containing protein [Myxococcota bacterium]
MVGLLSALPSTALWRRLETEGRLLGSANGDPFSRPNFTPAMDTRVLLVGYAKLLAWLYSPNAYYHRCETYLDQVGSRPKTRPATADDIRAFLRSLWHIGVRSPRRLLFWRLLARSLPSGLARTRQAVVHAVQGEHLIRYTDEHVLPRLARSLAELSTEAAHRVDAVPTPTNARALARAALCGTVLR